MRIVDLQPAVFAVAVLVLAALVLGGQTDLGSIINNTADISSRSSTTPPVFYSVDELVTYLRTVVRERPRDVEAHTSLAHYLQNSVCLHA